ncbi:hypothetical protein DFH11DRAFT_963426 [Phellopilus nigrolimitatus]|nr:hypothetical protein DFH11DRAFT_963426 [Phellopilus nigrolimitatus]
MPHGLPLLSFLVGVGLSEKGHRVRFANFRHFPRTCSPLSALILTPAARPCPSDHAKPAPFGTCFGNALALQVSFCCYAVISHVESPLSDSRMRAAVAWARKARSAKLVFCQMIYSRARACAHLKAQRSRYCRARSTATKRTVLSCRADSHSSRKSRVLRGVLLFERPVAIPCEKSAGHFIFLLQSMNTASLGSDDCILKFSRCKKPSWRAGEDSPRCARGLGRATHRLTGNGFGWCCL